jgi:hypothetical protein
MVVQDAVHEQAPEPAAPATPRERQSRRPQAPEHGPTAPQELSQ